ncbi:Protein of unknown function [Leuconostoc citreum LBAE C11]|nr:Protein of unknown function [Leuconostoc citreum LBAE C11]
MTNKTLNKIGFQHVGSFLRPEQLKQARADYETHKITAAELEKVTDEKIKQLVEKQVAAGLDIITDGEFRRSYWHLDNFGVLVVLNVSSLAKGIVLPMKKHVMTQHV